MDDLVVRFPVMIADGMRYVFSVSVATATETVAIQRRLRRSMAEIESLDPDSNVAREYRAFSAMTLKGLSRLREEFEHTLVQAHLLSQAQLKLATETLNLVRLVESEFTPGAGTTH